MRMTLREYANRYVQRVDGSTAYCDQLRYTINALERCCGRTLFIDEITTTLINEVVAQWKNKLSSVTTRSRRNNLYRLARIASRDDGLAVRPPKPVRDDLNQVKRKNHAPWAYEDLDVVRLLEHVVERRGFYRVGNSPIAGVPLTKGQPWVRKADYWESYIRAVWDCGLRSVDMSLIRRDQVPDSGTFVITQHKTGKFKRIDFRPETMEAINRSFALTPDRELIWPVWLSRGSWFRIRQRLLRRVGLKGGMNRLRHTAGTYAELATPGAGCRLLGNTPDVFFKHYFDSRRAEAPVQPPPLPKIEPQRALEHRRPAPRIEYRPEGGAK